MTHEVQAVAELLGRYGLVAVSEPAPVPGSVLNKNFRVETDAGPRFVRIYRERERGSLHEPESFQLEAAAIAWAAERGIPVCPPLADSTGRWLHPIGGQTLSLSPWVEGIQARRGSVTLGQARAMGDMHGRIHAAFQDFRHDWFPAGDGSSAWDTEESIRVLSRIDDLIRYYPSPGEQRLRIQESLRFQLGLLESGEARPASEYGGARRQPSHGDFHERNVIFNEQDAIVAVVDWELVRVLAPVYEILRCLTFAGLLSAPLRGPYLEGYQPHSRLSRQDCEDGMAIWWQATLHSTWVLRQVFIAGDDRAAQFLVAEGERTARFANPAYRQGLLAGLIASLVVA